MSMDKKQQKTDRGALISIGAKLVTIITLIVLVSLGSITALVSWLVRQDLQITAEDNNFEANRQASAEAENTLARMRSYAMILAHTVDSLGTQGAMPDLARDNTAFFFGGGQGSGSW